MRQAFSRRGPSPQGWPARIVGPPGGGRINRSACSCSTPRSAGRRLSTARSICQQPGRPTPSGERRAAAHIPREARFATKGELARGMLARAFATGAPARCPRAGSSGTRSMAAMSCVAGWRGRTGHPCWLSPAPIRCGVAGARTPSRTWPPPCPRTPGSASRLGRGARGHAATTGPGCGCPMPTARRGGRSGCSCAAARLTCSSRTRPPQ
jgi:hypothetical protein